MQTNRPKLIKGLFIDPYKRQVSLVEVANDIHVWHKLLRCDCCSVEQLMPQRPPDFDCVDLWFDDEFLLKEPVGPGFQLNNYGYALMLSSDSNGDSSDMALFAELPPGDKLTVADHLAIAKFTTYFSKVISLNWEPWENRLGEDSCTDQLMRIPELELPKDSFRLLAVLE